MNTIIQAKNSLQIPICLIGGITTQNAEQIKQQSQADMLAIISDVFDDFDENQSKEKINFYNSLFAN